MAPEDKKSGEGKVPRLSRKGIYQSLRALAGVGQLTTSMVYETDPKNDRQSSRDVEHIRSIIGRVSRDYKTSTGPNIVEFFNRLSSEEAKGDAKRKGKLVPVSQIIEKAEQSLVSNIMYMEMDRVQRYDTFESLHNHIPQIAMGLEAYVDSILNPDGVTKSVLNLTYEGSGNKDLLDSVKERLGDLNRMYAMEDKAPQILLDTLKLGDQFVATLKMDRELRRLMLAEDGSTMFGAELHSSARTFNEATLLESSDIIMESFELEALVEATMEHMKSEKRVPNKPEELERVRRDVAVNMSSFLSEAVNSQMTLGTSSSISDLSKQYRTEYSKMQSDVNSFYPGQGGGTDTEREGTGKGWRNVGGSITKILDPRKVIKLSVDEICYGYYYIEKAADVDFGRQPKNGYTDMLSGVQSQFAGTRIMEQQTKSDIIANLFIKTVAKRLNNKFLADNPEFKGVIYNLLQQGYLTTQKVKITFFTPDEVEHFKLGAGEYGTSIYQKILFSAKLYMAVLTSTLMNKLVRGPDKRVFYVEVGLDNDVESAIQSFIRDIKSKDLRLDDLGNLTTIFNSVGQFHDLYVPVINGEKPVEVETMSGSEAALDSDFLEYLRKTMISGMGVPATFLQYSDEIEFAKGLSMQNLKFAKSVGVFQKMFGERFSNVFRTLYRNEYLFNDPSERKKDEEEAARLVKPAQQTSGGADIVAEAAIDLDDDSLGEYEDDRDDVEKKKKKKVSPYQLRRDENFGKDPQSVGFEIMKVFVRFPPPASLNLTNMLEQVNNARDVITSIVDAIIGADVEPGQKRKATLAVTKEIVTSIDWQRFEKIVSEAVESENIQSLLVTDPNADTGGGEAPQPFDSQSAEAPPAVSSDNGPPSEDAGPPEF